METFTYWELDMYLNESKRTFNAGLTKFYTYLIVMGPVTVWLVYAGWIVFIINRIWYLKNKKKVLRTKNFKSEKTSFLKYKYSTEYYKHLLLLSTIIMENFTYIPAILDIAIRYFFPTSIIAITAGYVLRGLSYVTFLVTLCMMNTIVIFMTYIILMYTEFSEIKKRLRRIVIMAVILILVSIIGLGLLTQIFCAIRSFIEYTYIIKNSKYLYSILKEQYRYQITEGNYQFYRAQKHVANIYKWFSIFVLAGILIAVIALCLEIPLSILESAFIIGVLFNKNNIYSKRVTSAMYIIKWVLRSMMLLSGIEIFLTIIGYSVYLVIRSYRIREGRKNGRFNELETSLIN